MYNLLGLCRDDNDLYLSISYTFKDKRKKVRKVQMEGKEKKKWIGLGVWMDEVVCVFNQGRKVWKRGIQLVGLSSVGLVGEEWCEGEGGMEGVVMESKEGGRGASGEGERRL